MRAHRHRGLPSVFGAAVVALSIGAAHAEGLAVGGIAGAATWESGPKEESGLGAGVVARYTVPVADGISLKAHVGALLEGAEFGDDLSYSAAGSEETLRARGGIDWSLDALALVAADLPDRVTAFVGSRLGVDGGTAYAGGGFSWARVSASQRGAVVTDQADVAFSDSESDRALGYKLVIGLEIPASDRVVLFGQVEYADYGDVDVEAFGDLASLGFRLGALYRF